MADNSLTTTSGTGTQATTQSPQAAGAANAGGTASSKVQSGTAENVLRSNDGVQLKPTPVTTINLNRTATGTTAQPTTSSKHHIHPVLGIFSVTLFVLAIVLFWATGRSAKNTT